MQAAIKEDRKLCRVVEDYLARERYISGEQDFFDCAAELAGALFGQYGIDGALRVTVYFAKKRLD